MQNKICTIILHSNHISPIFLSNQFRITITQNCHFVQFAQKHKYPIVQIDENGDLDKNASNIHFYSVATSGDSGKQPLFNLNVSHKNVFLSVICGGF